MNSAKHTNPCPTLPFTLRAFHRDWAAYQVFNGLGLLLGTGLALILARHLELSLWLVLAGSLAGLVSIYGLALAGQMLTGEKHLLNNYHAQVTFLVIVGILMAALHQPAPAYLDLATLGIATMIGCGRIGCLHAGCCHGRPARRGICYGPEHVAEGMEAYLAGVHLFPLQALASGWALLIAVTGTLLVLAGAPAGTAFGWHVVAYGVGRFVQEFWRGDAGRRYRRGFSEAQWTALLSIWALVGATALGWLPAYVWQPVAGAGLALGMRIVSVWRNRQAVPRHALLHANHIHELARGLYALQYASGATDSVHMVTTSLGIRLSAGKTDQDDGPALYHYTLSQQDGTLDAATAALLGELIVRLRHAGSDPHTRARVVNGQQPGVFHVLVS